MNATGPLERGARQRELALQAYAHLKVIGYLPTAAPLLVKAGMSDASPDRDAGLISLAESSDIGAFITAAAGWVWAREPMFRKVF